MIDHSVAQRFGTRWTANIVQRLGTSRLDHSAVITGAQAQPMTPELDVWDAWPLAGSDGSPIPYEGGELWFALAVERTDDPESRHLRARIHHFHRLGESFRHLGETLPGELNPGTCMWSGSALYEAGKVTLFFTATGQPGNPEACFNQRIFATSATLGSDGRFGDWDSPVEIIRADGEHYRPVDQAGGEPGKIKAFRDPSYFRGDEGERYILFTGSSAKQPSAYDGVIGIGIADGPMSYLPLPPLIEATGVNNELERPHIIRYGGKLYLFWSTQRGVFAPGIVAPTGLYGATANSIEGPWQFLNGHGLVIANPAESPTQAYSWWVLPDLTVASFVDYWLPEDLTKPERDTRRERFGGTFAPFLRISLDGAVSKIEPIA